MVYGYARVSTKDQNLDRQIEQLMKYVDDRRYIFDDEESGKDFNRTKYNLLVGTPESAPLLREGDLLIVCSIDRFGRNYTEIQKQWEYITQVLKADIKVLDIPLLDTSIKRNDLDQRFMANLILQILSYVSEKERQSMKIRQAQGIAVMPVINGKKVSKKTGNAVGRPNATYPDRWEEVYDKWKAEEITATAAMQELALKRTTFYKLVKQYEKNAP